ncbi:MAG: DMT family transporter [Deltaproteobacteria bacterium]|nr:DMT family transporter [Deltaproteobacteria bacterium]
MTRPTPQQPAVPSVAQAALALLAVQLVLGVWPVVGVLVLRHVSVQVLVGARIVLAGPLLLLLTRPWRAGMSGREIARCAALGWIGVILNQTLFVEGLARSTPVNAAVLGCLIPAWTLLVAAALGHEKLERTKTLGVAVALAGALLLVGAERLDLGAERSLGNLLLASNGLMYATYLVLSRPLIARYGARPVVGWAFGLSTPLILPYAGSALVQTDWLAQPPEVALGLAYIVVGATVVGYLLSGWAMLVLPASTAAAFSYTQPLITGVAAGGVLGERPGWQVAAAAALIFAGVGVLTWGPRPSPR